jgi:hypothetical protein
MAHQTVTATAFARKFSDYLNQVRYQGMSFDVKRGSDVIACVTPPTRPSGFPMADIDRLLGSLPGMNADEAAAFAHDIRAIDSTLTSSPNAWDE